MADDLAHDFLGAAVVRLGPPLPVLQSLTAALAEEFKQLIVTLPAVTVLLGGLSGAQALALAVDQHDELTKDWVVGLDGQRAF